CDRYYAAAGRPARAGARRGAGGAAVAGEPTARDVMTPDVFGVAPSATVPELVAFLVRSGVHRALVLDGTRLVGIVSVTDLLPVIAEGGEGWPG
ncbi:MAG: CBS domain-containing protein, partial [Gemmatimonadetes bacterium]|nr:CBS domain-containing protein [Gemmatimonadota bacterium]